MCYSFQVHTMQAAATYAAPICMAGIGSTQKGARGNLLAPWQPILMHQTSIASRMRSRPGFMLPQLASVQGRRQAGNAIRTAAKILSVEWHQADVMAIKSPWCEQQQGPWPCMSHIDLSQMVLRRYLRLQDCLRQSRFKPPGSCRRLQGFLLFVPKIILICAAVVSIIM